MKGIVDMEKINKEDLIRRSNAIDALRTCYDTEAITYTNGNEYIDYDQALDSINTLPSVEQKTGKWIRVHGIVTLSGDPIWRCSECGEGLHSYGIEASTYGAEQWVSCPNCGTRMEGETEVTILPSAQPEQPSEIQDILNYLDTVLHPIISPEHWDVYSDLHDMISMLPSVQPETAKRIVGKSRDGMTLWYQCDMCNEPVDVQDNYCRGCGRRLNG